MHGFGAFEGGQRGCAAVRSSHRRQSPAPPWTLGQPELVEGIRASSRRQGLRATLGRRSALRRSPMPMSSASSPHSANANSVCRGPRAEGRRPALPRLGRARGEDASGGSMSHRVLFGRRPSPAESAAWDAGERSFPGIPIGLTSKSDHEQQPCMGHEFPVDAGALHEDGEVVVVVRLDANFRVGQAEQSPGFGSRVHAVCLLL